jgi:hypothetical protein
MKVKAEDQPLIPSMPYKQKAIKNISKDSNIISSYSVAKKMIFKKS